MGTAVLIPNRAAAHAGLGSSTAGTPAIYGSNGARGSTVDVADFAYSGVKFNKPVKFTKPVKFENASGTPVSYACFTASGALVSSMTPCVRDMVVSRR